MKSLQDNCFGWELKKCNFESGDEHLHKNKSEKDPLSQLFIKLL